MRKLSIFFVCALSLCSAVQLLFAQTGKLPVGMNIQSLNYYGEGPVFNDVMTTASAWITYVDGESAWSTGKTDEMPVDSSGYPLELPFAASDGKNHSVRFLINNNYSGRYVVLYDGETEFTIRGVASGKTSSGNHYVDLNGNGGHVFFNVKSSTKGNHFRNVRIVPEAYESKPDSMPLFYAPFLEGLKPFHTFRFMDWTRTNNSEQAHWDDRAKPYDYTQGLGKGIAIEYAVELCNLLQTDAWFCVPHKADDNYITEFAKLVKSKLHPSLKVYIEYSNEIWNWQFDQSRYVLKNAPEHSNAYVSEALEGIDPNTATHPEKDAYMMQRTFGLWSDVFTGADAGRLVRVATGQQAWVDNSRRILQYLFKKDVNGNPLSGERYASSTGAGCDMFSVTAYFNFSGDQHALWLNRCDTASAGAEKDTVAAEEILDSVMNRYMRETRFSTIRTAEYANTYGVGYAVYEGGQHMQPYQQKEWCYNQSVWDAQIHPKMYDIYMENFKTHLNDTVSCKLFCAFSYVSSRESKYGSWGHLEDYSDIHGDLMQLAPKYKALLDVNSVKENRDTAQTLTLKKGWNLVSLNIIPRCSEIDSLLPKASTVKDLETFYRASTLPCFNTLRFMKPGSGYLVYYPENATVTIEGAKMPPESKFHLDKGWNLVGAPTYIGLPVSSLPPAIAVIKDFSSYYDADSGTGDLTELQGGRAYLIFCTEESDIGF